MKKIISQYRVWNIPYQYYVDTQFVISSDGELFRKVAPAWINKEASPQDYIVEYNTGITDRHEKPIYEGDIVRMRWAIDFDSQEEKDYVVIWAAGHAGFALMDVEDEQCIFTLEQARNGTIVGNVHESDFPWLKKYFAIEKGEVKWQEIS